jgi:MFS family permease
MRGKIQSAPAALAMLSGLNVLNYLDRYVGAAVLPLMLTAFSLTDAKGGMLQSAFIVVYSLMSPVAGWLGDRRARLPLAAAGVLIWSVATLGTAAAPTFAVLLVARALIGVGEASYGVITPALVSDYYPAEKRARVLAIFYAAIPVGTALGYIVGGSVGSHWGWRAAFLVAGIPGAILGLALLLLQEPPRGGSDAAGAHGGAGGIGVGAGLGETLRALGARRSYLFNTATQVLYSFAMGGLATWMPTYFVRVRGLPLETATTRFGLILVLAGFAGTLVGGTLSDRLEHRIRAATFTVSGVGLLLSLVFTLLAVLHPAPAVYWPAMFGTLFLLFLNTGPLNAAIANVLPASLRARGFAITTMVMHLLGDALSPWLIGVASDHVGLTAPTVATGVLLALSGVVLLAGRGALERDLAAARSAPSEPAPVAT